ncbi:MAG: hypothetical protein IJQ67_00385 [Bacilli bacterium]|nr:hypothetical protein [Bacilli bacterium]
MSPDELNFVSASEVRSRYAFVFECVIQLYDFRFSKKPSKKFEEVVNATEELHDVEALSEYLYENLKVLYELYPSMMPGKVAEGYEKNRKSEEERLTRLDKLLGIVIGDLCGEIQEISDKASEHDRAQLAFLIKTGYTK